MGKLYEIRDPIHGFITISDWEREIINQPAFQRLRRIRQLGLTEMVYPGTVHTRFEHSLGVMHLATLMFDRIRNRRREFLSARLSFDETGLARDRVLLRLACLLHDVGHPPFSHSAEDLMPKKAGSDNHLSHEDYSCAAVRHVLRDVIEGHKESDNYGISADDIADFMAGNPGLGRSLLWRGLLSGQLDADRADYLLRDSHHAGVGYGKYDLHRIIATLTVAVNSNSDTACIAVEEGGEHAAEALIIARYMMFTQVYFQHTRRAYDQHCAEAVSYLLSSSEKQAGQERTGRFPSPGCEREVREYLKWDDWAVLGEVSAGKAGEHGEIILNRKHHRAVFETPEVPSQTDLDFALEVQEALSSEIAFVDRAANSWYKFEAEEIPILLRPGSSGEDLVNLSTLSPVVKGLKSVSCDRIYVPYEKRHAARDIVAQVRSERKSPK